MKLKEFKMAVEANENPFPSDNLLSALYYDAMGNWEKAHLLAQEIETQSGSWVHGYLHRKEGDLGNASYWYALAGKRVPSISLEDEWDEIADSLL